MASGRMLGGDDSRDDHRWAESKVYSRKSQNKYDGRKSGNLLPHLASDDVNSSHYPSSIPNPPADEDDASSLNRPIQNNSNRQRMATISLQSRTREEVKHLRKKLAAELELVRAMVRKIEAHELQASAVSTSLVPAAGYTLSQLSASDPNPPLPVKRLASSSDAVSCRPQINLSAMPVEISLNEGAEKDKRATKSNQHHRNSDFLPGKERLPSFEPHGHKKPKINETNKATVMEEMNLPAHSNTFISCSDLLSKLMKHKHGWVFNVPVDARKLNIPDYRSIVKRPMDLGTVRSRLSKNWYKTPAEFAEDVRLTFKNAMTYNPKGQDVHHMAEQLLNMFDERWPSIEGQYMNASKPSPATKKMPAFDSRNLERSDSTANPTPVETKSRAPCNAPPIGRPLPMKKPKAKDPDKRDMTFEEKQRLSNNLQNLPPEKLENIVQIIKKRNSSLSQHDDEIEVDIDSVDVETLWELDRFVTNYKKNLSKNKRKEKLAVLARTGVESNASERVNKEIGTNETAGERREDKTVMDEKDISSGSRLREENKLTSLGRSMTSSSNSDSGSSSCDSDSENSSAYRVDGAQLPRT